MVVKNEKLQYKLQNSWFHNKKLWQRGGKTYEVPSI